MLSVSYVGPWTGCSLSFLEDQGIELIRPSPELAELHSQASSISEAEVLFALQVSIYGAFFSCCDSFPLSSCAVCLFQMLCAVKWWTFVAV
jgi:hypothetical protein